MRISAKVDYAVRALCEIAARSGDVPVKADEIARAQDIPHSFLENILVDLRRAGFVRSLRGQVGSRADSWPGRCSVFSMRSQRS